MKVFFSVFMALLLVSNTSSAQAKGPAGDVKQENYATTTDMLLDFIHQPVEKFVQKEYGKKMEWHGSRITDLQRVQYTEKREGPLWWYEAKVAIFVKDDNRKRSVWNVDTLTLKFIPPSFQREAKVDMNDLGDTKFKLLDYEHTVK